MELGNIFFLQQIVLEVVPEALTSPPFAPQILLGLTALLTVAPGKIKFQHDLNISFLLTLFRKRGLHFALYFFTYRKQFKIFYVYVKRKPK